MILLEFSENEYLLRLQVLAQIELSAHRVHPSPCKILITISRLALPLILVPFGPRAHFFRTIAALDRAFGSPPNPWACELKVARGRYLRDSAFRQCVQAPDRSAGHACLVTRGRADLLETVGSN